MVYQTKSTFYQTKSILLVYYIVSWTGTLIFMLPEAQNLQISSTTVVIPGIFYSRCLHIHCITFIVINSPYMQRILCF